MIHHLMSYSGLLPLAPTINTMSTNMPETVTQFVYPSHYAIWSLEIPMKTLYSLSAVYPQYAEMCELVMRLENSRQTDHCTTMSTYYCTTLSTGYSTTQPTQSLLPCYIKHVNPTPLDIIHSTILHH